MIKHKSYILSGKGVVPEKSLAIINSFRDAGVEFFSYSRRGGHCGGPTNSMYLFPAEEINEKTRQAVFQALKRIGLKDVRLEKTGEYTGR